MRLSDLYGPIGLTILGVQIVYTPWGQKAMVITNDSAYGTGGYITVEYADVAYLLPGFIDGDVFHADTSYHQLLPAALQGVGSTPAKGFVQWLMRKNQQTIGPVEGLAPGVAGIQADADVYCLDDARRLYGANAVQIVIDGNYAVLDERYPRDREGNPLTAILTTEEFGGGAHCGACGVALDVVTINID